MCKLRLGSRGSRLALWQAELVAREIRLLQPAAEVEIKVIKTQGDKILDTALSKIGDKGLFTKEIENELLSGEIDLAVHSLKDLPTVLPPGLIVGGVLKRENPQDVLISHKGYKLDSLPWGALVGTSSLRRIAQLRAIRPDLQMVDLRGNVETRIKKMIELNLDAIILAYAGVKRLGFERYVTEMIDPGSILPAVSQGAIAIEIREGDKETLQVVGPLNDQPTYLATLAERALLRELEGGCQVPIGSLAEVKDNLLHLQAIVASEDGKKIVRDSQDGNVDSAAEIGRILARRLLHSGAAEILAQIRQ